MAHSVTDDSDAPGPLFFSSITPSWLDARYDRNDPGKSLTGSVAFAGELGRLEASRLRMRGVEPAEVRRDDISLEMRLLEGQFEQVLREVWDRSGSRDTWDEYSYLGVRASVGLGDWDSARQFLQRPFQPPKSDGDAGDRRFAKWRWKCDALTRVDAMRVAQRTEDARQLLASIPIEWPGDDAEELGFFEGIALGMMLMQTDMLRPYLKHAHLATSLGMHDDAERVYRHILEMDPLEPQAARGMYDLLRTSGTPADISALNQFIRELRSRWPGADLIRELQARELAAGALDARAEPRLIDLVLDRPDDEELSTLLGQVWGRLGVSDERVWKRGRAFFERIRDEYPGAAAPRLGIAMIQREQDGPEAAASSLRSALSDLGDASLSIALETIVRDDLGRDEEAMQFAIARLQTEPKSPRVAADLAFAYFSAGEPENAARAFSECLAPWSDPNQADRQRIRQVLQHVSVAAIGRTDLAIDSAVAAMLERADQIEDLPFELQDARLRLLARLPDAPADRVWRAAQDLLAKSAEPRMDAVRLTIQTLVQSGRPDDAIAFSRDRAEQENEPIRYLEWRALSVAYGEASDVREVIASAIAHSPNGAMLGNLFQLAHPSMRNTFSITEELAAEMANQMGYEAYSLGRNELSTECYRIALEYQPDHAWAANNLGYEIVVTGGDLGEAERLLLTALSQLEDNANVLDSIGWLRVHQGWIEDRDVADGRQAGSGALTYLGRAARTQAGRQNPTILDHYADALWLAGREEDALRFWADASRVALALIERSRFGNTAESVIESWRETQQRAATKRQAVSVGEQPDIGPFHLPADSDVGPMEGPKE